MLSLVWFAAVAALRFIGPPWLGVGFIPHGVLLVIGVVLIAGGLVFYVVGLVALARAYNADALQTGGAFALCRHPIYAAWALFIVPGVVLLMGSWLGLATPVVMGIVTRVLVGKEERYLAARFGEAYRVYKRRVPAILPLGRLGGGFCG